MIVSFPFSHCGTGGNLSGEKKKKKTVDEGSNKSKSSHTSRSNLLPIFPQNSCRARGTAAASKVNRVVTTKGEIHRSIFFLSLCVYMYAPLGLIQHCKGRRRGRRRREERRRAGTTASKNQREGTEYNARTSAWPTLHTGGGRAHLTNMTDGPLPILSRGGGGGDLEGRRRRRLSMDVLPS